MLRVVLDTNVLVAALRSRRGASFKVLSRIGEQEFEIALSVPLVLEYEEVALKHLGDTSLREADLRAILDYMCRVGRRQPIFFLWRPFLPDPEDDMILEIAVAAECDAIVTFNRSDFRGAEKFGIEIISPVDLLRETGAGE